MTDPHAFQPTFVSPPGDTIEHILEVKGWSKRELAQRTGYTEKHISQLTSGEATLTEDAALRLERVLGGAASFWLAREAKYREALAREKEERALEAEIPWLKELPLTDMRRWGWKSKTRDKTEQVREALHYFGVASAGAWRERYEAPLTAFRASRKHAMKPGSVAAWVRRGELDAEQMRCAPFDRSLFATTLRELRALTREEAPEKFLPELREKCAQCGVAVVIAPAPKGCPAFGMTKWLKPDKALLMLSLRYKTNDHLWFTFFHEAGHLLLHGKKLVFIEGVDGLDEELENEANRFAADLLIPPADAARLSEIGRTAAAVRAFAEHVGIHPGIVVGRMQYLGVLRPNARNELRVRYDWEAFTRAFVSELKQSSS